MALLLGFEDLQAWRSHHLSGSCPRAALLSQRRALSSRPVGLPCHCGGLLTLQGLSIPHGPCKVCFNPFHLILQGEQSLSSSAIPVALHWALQFLCLSPPPRIQNGMLDASCTLKHWHCAKRNRKIICN